MKKTLLYLFLMLQSPFLISGFALAEDWPSPFQKQYSSEPPDFQSSEEKEINVAISIHNPVSARHLRKRFVTLDMKHLKREAEMERLYNTANEQSKSPNIVAVFRMAFDEFKYLKELRRILDGVEAKVENYQYKLKLKGEVGFAEQHHTATSDRTGDHSETSMVRGTESEKRFSHRLPARISWHLSYDLDSNYLKGELEIGNHFFIKANWGSDSDVRAVVTFPF